MRRVLPFLLTLVPLSAVAEHDPVVLLHFSDYHSHAVPFFTERGPSQGGIARAIGYLERERKRGGLVFNGGDMMNRGAPAWSDRYGCAEWPWLDGIVDAMALGNHDVDYGREAFAKCRAAIRYPILSANTEGFEGTRVFEAKGKRIGVFAVAGPDLPRLMKPSGLNFSDPVEAARRAVASLRGQEVDAIVMLGHQQTEDDYALAKSVPGIDVIFGTHAHLTRELTQIPGTSTWFISPGQYLETISRVELTFSKDGLAVAGRLVPVDASLRPSRKVARHVASMQRALERDPKFREMFEPVGRLARPMKTAEVAELTLRLMRNAARAEVALSTVSSFRGPLDAGVVTLESLNAAMPYDNEIVVCTMSGEELRRLLLAARSREGDSRAYVSAPEEERLGRAAKVRVATTDYMARAYAEFFSCEIGRTGTRVRDALLRELAKR